MVSSTAAKGTRENNATYSHSVPDSKVSVNTSRKYGTATIKANTAAEAAMERNRWKLWPFPVEKIDSVLER